MQGLPTEALKAVHSKCLTVHLSLVTVSKFVFLGLTGKIRETAMTQVFGVAGSIGGCRISATIVGTMAVARCICAMGPL